MTRRDRGPSRRAGGLFLTVCWLAGGVQADPDARSWTYGVVSVGSWHVQSETLNNFTPGLGLGRGYRSPWPGFEWHIETAVFYNSYEELSVLALGGASQRMFDAGPFEMRLAVSLGTGYYPELSERLEETRGLPTAGGFVPMGVLALVARKGATDIRIATVPPDDDATAVFNLNLTHRF